MPRESETKPVRIGVAWFDREQWLRLTEVVPNRNELDDTFQQWERNAKKTLEDLERRRQLVEKVPIKVDELLAWCTLRGLTPNGKARSEYVIELMQKKYETKP
jgi:hypothetical protein